MADAPEIRYARNGGVAIAYQVVGDGPTDLVFVPDYVSNLIYAWQSRYWRAFYDRLARSFRLILFDKRGTGLSDHGSQFPALETKMEDVRAVLDAAASESAVVLGAQDGCFMAALYAATYPERTRALVLFQPWVFEGVGDEQLHHLARVRDRWGTQEFADELLRANAPALYADDEDRAWFANWLRVGASPAVAYALNRAVFETHMRDVLPAIRAPTLVLVRGDYGAADAAEVARLIPGSRSTRLPGDDFWGIFLSPEIADEIEAFATGSQAPAVPDTVLTTVLFTDIVGSTEHTARLGDRGWRELLARHHALVRRELARFRGQERDTAGDGFFATFDGPARAIRCAQTVADGVRGLGLEIRAGVHTGECELHDGKVAGIAVSIGARVAGQAQPGEVLVTGTVRDLVAGSGVAFEPRGEHELEGVPGTWSIYAVSGG
ncbi:MAG: adenylate/guanylate cyclase domain-containing protein [Thermoleophilia bacterium]|nr:adenylate/guanylate cyclase domain-containing protein [Thermoleophilia bacterium]